MNNLFLSIGIIVMSILPLMGFISQANKISVSMLLCFCLCLKALFKGSLKIRDKSLIALLCVLPLTIWFGLRVDYRVYLSIGLFVLGFISLSREEAEKSVKVALWCAFGMTVYGILQYLGFESPSILKTTSGAVNTPSFAMGGLLGNPTYLGAYIAMMIPLAIKYNKWWSILMIIAVLMTQSAMAIGAMCVSLVAIPFMMSKKRFIIGCIIATVLFCGIGLGWKHIRPKIGDSGRFGQWSQIVKACDKGMYVKDKGIVVLKKFNLFGFGGGSYKEMFPNKILKENFNTCHNEYLQIYVEFGIVTLVLFLFFIICFISRGYDVYTKASLICICLNALGLFVWQLGITQFMTLFVLCLNKSEVSNG